MDDAEDQNDSFLFQDVIHDAVVTNTQSMEGVCDALDRLRRLAPDAPGFSNAGCELLQSGAHSSPDIRRQLLEHPDSGGCELDVV